MEGLIPLIASVLCFSLPPILYRKGLERYESTFRANFVRILYTLPVLAISIPSLRSVSIEVLMLAFCVGLLGGVVGDVAYLTSMKILGAGLATALSYTYPVFVAPLASLTIGEELGYATIVGLILVVAGTWLASYEEGERVGIAWRGVALALSAAISWAAASVIAKIVLQRMDPLTLAFLRNVSVALLLSWTAPTKLSDYVSKHALLLGIGSIVALGLGLYFYYQAIALVGATTTSIATSAAPAITIVASRFLLRERYSARKLLGAALAITGSIVAVVF